MAIIFFVFSNTKAVDGDHVDVRIFTYKHDLNDYFERRIELSRNKTADPCEDFYAYSCGNFLGYFHNNKSGLEITQYLNEKYDGKLMEIFEPKQSVDRKHQQTLFTYGYDLWSNAWNSLRYAGHRRNKQTFREKAQNYYESCINENRTNLMKYFDELQIRWPLLSAQDETPVAFSKEDFWQVLGRLHSYNWNNLIIAHEITANKDGSLNIILEAEINIEQLSKLPADIAIEAILKGLKIDNATVIVQQLMETQQKWLEIFQNDTTNEYTYTGITLKNIAAKYPFLKLYLEQLLGGKMNKIDHIWLRNISFFNYFRDIEWPAAEWQQQLNYLMVHFLFYLFEDSSSEFTRESCINDLRNKLDLAVSYIYHEQIGRTDRRQYEHMLGHLNDQIDFVIRELFKENRLHLSRQQVKDLKHKLHRIRVNIGNLPCCPVSKDAIERFYNDLPDLENGNYFKNHLLLLKHRFRKSLLYQEDLNFYIASDNSVASSSSLFYLPKQNLVVIPYASLQYPLYHYEYYAEHQLPLMGFLMAHEIGHAFDNNGLTISKHYSIVEQVSYKKSLECMQKQKPTKDIEERIADLFAERVAYRAYKTFYNEKYPQHFYLSLAQFFCNKDPLEFIDHDADAVRLHQIVMNSQDFARAFYCPLNSPMNPQEKCRLY